MGLEHNIKLRTGLKENNCPASAFSVLASPPLTSKKYSQQFISQLVAGTRELSDQEAAELLGVVNVMTHLQSIVTPKIPVDWSNVLGVRDALVQTYEHYKTATDPLHKRCWFVRLSVLDFFAGFRSDGSEIRTVNYYESGGLAFTDGDLASEVVKKLKARDIISRVELLTCSRRQSTITTSVEEIGL
jgi:hypothetical protein